MSIFDDNYTSTTVPAQILDLPIKDNLIYVDVLNAGRKVGLTLDEQAAEDEGLVKNHCTWRVLLDSPSGLTTQLQFGFNLKKTQSVASDVAQYGGSSRWGGSSIGDRDINSDEVGVHSDVKSVLEKPATIDIGSLWAQATQLSITDDSSAQRIAPSILSSTGSAINQPTEDMVCVEQPRKHLYDLLPWKYSRPTVSANLSDEDIEDPSVPLTRGLKTTVSWIDRAWWPKDYVHFEHEKLLFNQPANN
ncbi:hypothetical protein PISMIDRAFT_497578 [Pisolithus microcarpus 441]|uniref:Uncharacterized protein n=1 Tax=Pisolithus microcarpus 441 TaxID=765257 RepID=A0A0C9YCM8_9AGAM|nr:hypothetical protein PISMIDRAFT_497578 [Pisolithus microcarpus 441]